MSAPPAAPHPVRARGVGYRYPAGRIGVEAVDLDVAPGQVVAAIGPNGSGKSTLLRLLATDLRATSGDLLLLGRAAAAPTPSLRRRIAWVPDDQGHILPLTGRENLRFFIEVRGRESVADATLAPLLRAFALDEVADVPVGRYSFGMRRKLLLAEGFAAEPDLLLLDEPTVGLDPPALEAFRLAAGAAARRGAAVVVATNEVRSVPEWATRVLFLHRGRVIRDADPESLLRSVRGSTRITIGLEGPPPQLPALDGVQVVRADDGRIEVESRSDARCLPPLLEALIVRGARVREVKVREPDLGDLFRAATGESLVSDEVAEAEPA